MPGVGNDSGDSGGLDPIPGETTAWRGAVAGLAVLLAVVACASSTPPGQDAGDGGEAASPNPAESAPDPTESEVSFDGLVRIEDSRSAKAYIDPDADFSIYERVMILEPLVAFRKNWLRDQNRTRRHNIRSSEMERIKADVAALFEQVFKETLEADDGFEVVDTAGADVLLLRPAIIDLDVTAPDTMEAGRNMTFASSAGAATLYIELFDSVSGEILGRAADRRTVTQPANALTWTNRTMNSAEARKLFRRWATRLREFLDQHYMK